MKNYINRSYQIKLSASFNARLKTKDASSRGKCVIGYVA